MLYLAGSIEDDATPNASEDFSLESETETLGC